LWKQNIQYLSYIKAFYWFSSYVLEIVTIIVVSRGLDSDSGVPEFKCDLTTNIGGIPGYV